MSLRSLPEDIAQRFAALEEFVRQLQSDRAISPTDTRFLYDQHGDVLFAAGKNNPQALHLPSSTPGIGGQWLLTANPGRPLGVEWIFVGGLSGSSSASGSGGSGGSSGGVTDHGGLTGLADDDHPQYLRQVEADALYDPIGTARYDRVQDEGVNLTQRSTLNFVGAGVAAADSGGVTTVTIAGGGGGSGEPGRSWLGI